MSKPVHTPRARAERADRTARDTALRERLSTSRAARRERRAAKNSARAGQQPPTASADPRDPGFDPAGQQ